MQIVDYATVGPASWYRDIAKTALGLVCAQPQGPPRSSREVLARMDLPRCVARTPVRARAGALSEAQVNQVRLRYEAFFGQARGVLDSRWAWEDTTAAYLLLDSGVAGGDERPRKVPVRRLRALLHQPQAPRPVLCADRRRVLRPRGQRGMAGGSSRPAASTPASCSRRRSSQGWETSEAARIIGSVETVICHRVNTPEEIIALAGTRRVIEYSSHYAMDGATGEGSARMQHQYKVDPNHVRSLPPGAAFIISRGRAMKAQVAQAPQLTTPLPEPAASGAGESSEGTPGKDPEAASAPDPPANKNTELGEAGALRAPSGVPPQAQGRMKGVEDLPF